MPKYIELPAYLVSQLAKERQDGIDRWSLEHHKMAYRIFHYESYVGQRKFWNFVRKYIPFLRPLTVLDFQRYHNTTNYPIPKYATSFWHERDIIDAKYHTLENLGDITGVQPDTLLQLDAIDCKLLEIDIGNPPSYNIRQVPVPKHSVLDMTLHLSDANE